MMHLSRKKVVSKSRLVNVTRVGRSKGNEVCRTEWHSKSFSLVLHRTEPKVLTVIRRKSRENRETGKAKSAKMDTNQSQWDAEVVDPTRSLQEVRNNHLENLEMDTSREAFIIPSPQEEYDSLEDLMKGISSIGSPRTPSARKVRTQDAWNAQGNKSARTPLKDQVQWTMIDRKG